MELFLHIGPIGNPGPAGSTGPAGAPGDQGSPFLTLDFIRPAGGAVRLILFYF